MNKRFLLIGDCCDDKWIGGFLRNCSFQDNNIDVYCANTNYSRNHFQDSQKICKELHDIKYNAPLFLYKLPVVRRILYIFDIYILLRDVLYRKEFDVINSHYVLPELSIIKINEHTKNFVITPWGSDVLRRSKIELFFLRTVFNRCQYITVPKTRFRDDIISKLGQPQSKFLNFGMGTDMIDYIVLNSDYTKEQAKIDLGLGNRFVIVCGYNAHPEQNHMQVIDSLAKIKNKLPNNSTIVIPMTYGSSQNYKNDIRNYIKSKGLEFVILESYMTQHQLLSLRKGADLFIHAQKTDNNSGSLAEHILAGSTVINAGWLKYPQYETLGNPYFVFDSFDELSYVLLKALKKDGNHVSNDIIDVIQNSGWSKVSKMWLEFIKSV